MSDKPRDDMESQAAGDGEGEEGRKAAESASAASTGESAASAAAQEAAGGSRDESKGGTSPAESGNGDIHGAVLADLKRTLAEGRRLAAGLAVLGAALYLASGLYAIKPEQRGVVFRFGRLLEEEALPGIHYRLPWPVDRVERLGTTEVRTLEVSFDEPKGTQKSAPGATGMSDALLTGDENLVLSTLLVQYTVVKPSDFLVRTGDPEGLMSRLARESAVAHFARVGVDYALTSGRQELQSRMRDDLQSTCDALGLGVRIASLQIRRIDPPSAVASAFKNVGSAREDRQKRVEEAQGERNRRLPEARGQAQKLKNEAMAEAREAVDHATGDAQRFVAAWEEYRKTREITAHQQYMEAVEAILPRVRKIIADPAAEGRTAPDASTDARR